MNIAVIFTYLGHLLVIEGLTMLPALAIAGYNGEMSSVRALIMTIVLAVMIGCPALFKKNIKGMIQAKEGFVIVGLGWILISFFGALPFYFSGAIPRFIDAWFETVSGFTTTGSSVVANIEIMPRSLLFWRSFTHWVGGMGVLVLLMAFFSAHKGSGEGLYLLRAESPGPTVGKLTPTIRHTARILYLIYLALSLLLFILLLLGGMTAFDSACHVFGTAGTGGFGIKSLSVGAYNSPYIDIVIGVFMLLFGINFSMFYLLLLRQLKIVWRNQELRLYLALIFIFTLIISIDVHGFYPSYGQALLHSFFQVSSIITTTGFATTDYNLWPQLSRCVLVVLTFIGACAGSTGGGIKCARLVILWKSLKSQMHVMLRPRAVRPVRVDDKTVQEETVQGVYAFLAAYVLIFIISILMIVLDNFDLETSVTSVITALGNTGPGLGMVGPRGNFSAFSTMSKMVLSADMLLGRLEIFPMILLFLPSTWKRQA